MTDARENIQFCYYVKLLAHRAGLPDEEVSFKAQAIKLVNEAVSQYFIGNAQLLRGLETVEKALANNAKIFIPSNVELINVVGELAGGILPVPRKEERK